MDDSIMTDPAGIGKVVETVIYKHIAAFHYQFVISVEFFRGGKKNKEIDVVVDYPNIKNILSEVRYCEGTPIADDNALVEFCEESSASIAITKTPTDFGVHNTSHGKDLLKIPVFVFCICLEMPKSTVIVE